MAQYAPLAHHTSRCEPKATPQQPTAVNCLLPGGRTGVRQCSCSGPHLDFTVHYATISGQSPRTRYIGSGK